ncbi:MULTISPECIES: DUF805 domain-containing protein [Streptomyces]|uniref:DUF805 domain-containing protein n=1 Tax=Streptomyces katrae TaxID=68223 RepID=A0ABT7H143_9ACTN|nr:MULTISPECIES: DUF805 domain-containing protein [Streptomyces]MDK9499612.1 DUF805 domain-containing protein [Streptomyces katrae]RST00725.1 DUF805 domain-containing protein [Streptomyces sp. WAC07149]GLX17585.1 aminopeptidase [Streptomyces lavendulae subsp. lavendulae]GLX24554.1 aminopeptidase [Streptomyces lavendulae subsp. lavendulae]
MHYYVDVIKRYADFAGRARRQEYWMFVLCSIPIMIVAIVLDFLLGSYPVIFYIYNLAVFLPTLGLSVRRLHDTGRSGWWYLIGFIPFVGWIAMIVLMALEGDAGPNEYGANPKQVTA